ncbi:MAG TPA: protein kinase [Thermoanaerobaculia bacterium]|nr:protein kinase [Thermoanaerobaculia bacterium]
MQTSTIEPGAALLHYRLVAPIGAGGMGVVWKAIDTTLDREVAVKILPGAFANDPERLARFAREAKLLASLNHPNVAAIYGLHQYAGGVHFLAMELVRGRTLTDEIANGLAPARVVELAAAIADGLAAAHRQHVIHRDLKPDNIMVDHDGRPKILDFGLAKLEGDATTPDTETALRDATTTRKGTLLGTVAYMSPEQAQGQPVDPRSDIFSFGIVLYEMTTGQRPFRGDNTISILSSILRDTPAPVIQLAPTAPLPLDRIIRHCLEKHPDARYSDASALRDEMLALRADLASDPGRSRPAPPRSAGRWILLAALGVLLLALPGAWLLERQAQKRWVRSEALPQLETIVNQIQSEDGRENWDAFMLARKIDAVAPSDPLVERLRQKFSRELTIKSDPPGATVSARPYNDRDADPVVIGKTPLTEVQFPRGFTRVQLELPGKRTAEDVVWNHPLVGSAWSYRLRNPSEVPDEMAPVPGGEFALFIPGLDHLKPEPTKAFLMDRHEVTNHEYKRFVDAGGYRDKKYWLEPFVDKARTLTWDEAISRFVDQTGRPGPATWEVGTHPEGRGKYPVSGVSWYEAAAYAEWAGKRLPTIFHWNRVAFTVGSSIIIPASNLSGDALLPVGSTKSMNRFGVADLAGNVREWMWNASDEGRERFILGGGWGDQDYAFVDSYAQSPFDRSPTNGFRCIRLTEHEPNVALQRGIDRSTRDFFAEKPVPDSLFAQYLRLFAYDKTQLDAKIEEETPTPLGIRQRITFAAAYGGERMTAYLFLPSSGRPPYQVVAYFPGSGSIGARSSKSLELGRVEFLQKSGRAVLWPIYKGTYERGGDLKSDYPSETTSYKDYVVMWSKDLGRSIDYLETRSDIDVKRLAYFGLSWGGALGAILPAIEPRIQANVLYVAGLMFQRALPEADQMTYLPRVRQPTLILNGEFDFFFPPETSQRPMFELLGTPPAHKKRLVFPGGHSVPRNELIKESLLWLDRYLGAVVPSK